MEEKLSFTLMLSLKEMALRKIAVVIMNAPDILVTTEKFRLPDVEKYKKDWFKTIEKITDKVSKLSLPESLTKEIIPILKAVGTEILKWNFFHKEFLKDSIDDFDVQVVEKLCWTTAGTVDYRRTAENLACSDVIDVEKRFKLTCLYCLKHCIPVVYRELPEESRRTFHNETGISPQARIPFRHFTGFILKKLFDYRGWDCVSVHPFKDATLLGHTTLAEYYFRKLSKEGRDASLVQIAVDVVRCRDPHLYFASNVMREKFSDVLCYLLSLMTPEEQMRVFKAVPCEVLRCFLDWPWQDLFLDVADIIWTFLPESKYANLLAIIKKNIYYSGYYFPNFLQELFLRCPRNFRKSFVDEEYRSPPRFFFSDHEGFFLRQFFLAEDSETIRVIFRNIEASDRVRLLFSEHFFKLLDDSLLQDKWCVAETCIREAALSKEDRARLKGDFLEYVTRTGNGLRVKGRTHKRRRFFEFLDGMDASPADKRRPEDETLTKVKKSRKVKKS